MLVKKKALLREIPKPEHEWRWDAFMSISSSFEFSLSGSFVDNRYHREARLTKVLSGVG
jgi:hypothetical protein